MLSPSCSGQLVISWCPWPCSILICWHLYVCDPFHLSDTCLAAVARFPCRELCFLEIKAHVAACYFVLDLQILLANQHVASYWCRHWEISVLKRVPVPLRCVIRKVKAVCMKKEIHFTVQWNKKLEDIRDNRTELSVLTLFCGLWEHWALKSSPQFSHYCLCCDQIPVIMWDPHDSCTSPAECSHVRARRHVACTQLLQLRWFLLQEEGVLRETHHRVSLLRKLFFRCALLYNIHWLFYFFPWDIFITVFRLNWSSKRPR